MSESCATDRSLGDERPRTRARFGRIGTSFCRCSLIVNNQMRACPPCCPGGLCVVLFHCRWASRVCAHRRIHDVSLHGSTVRRGEQARGNTRRSTVGRRSVALGLVRGNLLGISFFHLFIYFSFGIHFLSLFTATWIDPWFPLFFPPYFPLLHAIRHVYNCFFAPPLFFSQHSIASHSTF